MKVMSSTQSECTCKCYYSIGKVNIMTEMTYHCTNARALLNLFTLLYLHVVTITLQNFSWCEFSGKYLEFNPQHQNKNSSLLSFYVCYRRSEEKLLKYQANSSWEFISLILMIELEKKYWCYRKFDADHHWEKPQ